MEIVKMICSQVRKAENSDLIAVTSIQEYYLNRFGRKDYREGFLVNQLNESTFSSILKRDDAAFYVYQHEDKILGYLVAFFGGRNINPNHLEIFQSEFKEIIEAGDYVLLEQIAKKHGDKLNVAERLERELFEESKNRGFRYILAEFGLEPRNERTLGFHSNWQLVGRKERDVTTGVVWGIYAKNCREAE